MRRDIQTYVKFEDHEAKIDETYQAYQEELQRVKIKIGESIEREKAAAYAKGIEDTWKDAIQLIRRLSLKDAAEEIRRKASK